jgi:hypothetical protein
MLRMLPRYIEEDFDDPELTQIFNEAEERDDKLNLFEEEEDKKKEDKKKEDKKKEEKKDKYNMIYRRFLELKNLVSHYKKEYDDATEIMLLVSEGKMTSKLSMSELIKNLKDKHAIMKSASDEMQKCKYFLSTF